MRRKIISSLVLCALLAWSATSAVAQAPEFVSYQGTLFAGGVAYTGPAEFKFVIVDELGNTVWSNDGTSTAGAEPTASVIVPVANGVFSVLLGHPDLAMVPLFPEFLHDAPAPHLRIWVDSGDGFEQMSDVQLASTPFALESIVARRAIGNFLVDGEMHALAGIRFPDDTVQITAATGTGADADWVINGVEMYSGVSGNVGIGTATPQEKLDVVGGIDARDYSVKDAGISTIDLWTDGNHNGALALGGPSGSYLDRGCYLNGGALNGGGQMVLYNGSNMATVEMDGDMGDGGGWLGVSNGSLATGYLDGNGNLGGGELVLLNNANTTTYRVRGHAFGSGSQIETYDSNGLVAHQITAHNREMKVYDSTGAEKVRLMGAASGGELILFQNDAGLHGVTLDADNGGHGEITVHDNSGAVSVKIVGHDSGGNGRVITDILQIVGGADLSEQFDIADPSLGGATGMKVEPGMTVCIDPAASGRLAVSQVAYDRKVAGIVSGAGGVRPGMLMGQEGSLANGAHPVALTGRVWTWCDASSAPITPGDLLTTSSRPGHAMKASDRDRAPGATLGKAMSSLESGQGLVLVLVNLQ